MGRELQKKKNRSSISKVHHKPKSKKRLLQHPILAANWDKSQTLEQNYRRLGLTTKLNKNTGGTEKRISDVLEAANGGDLQNARDALKITPSVKRKDQIEVSEAKIERDPSTGNILRVLDDGSSDPKKTNPLNDPLAELDSDSDEEPGRVFALRNQHGNTDAYLHAPTQDAPGRTEVVRMLEEEARKPESKRKRKQPEGERDFIQALVRKYGEDYEKMARDIKINYMQRSEGDLRRRVKRWRENGGRTG